MNANPSNAELTIQVIKGSLLCFVFGWVGLIPVVGLPFALAALWIGGQVRVQERVTWNAAKPYRIWGIIIAAFSLILSSCIVMIVIFHVVFN
jgi:hypothetical protein